MGYCTQSDVQGMFKKIDFSASTAVTSTAVDALIAAYSARMDAKLSKIYVVPIVAADPLKILKLICQLFVGAEVHEILVAAQPEAESDLGERAPAMRKRADSLLQEILDGTTPLVGATSATAGACYNYNVANSVTPTMKRDTKQW